MLSTTGRKEKLSVSKGSEIEVSSNEYSHTTGDVWYRALLQQDLPQSKRTKLSVRHLNPLSNEDYSPPLITTAFHRLLRPLPPLDPFTDVVFEEGDVIDAAHKGGWWSGWVIKVLGSGRFLVYVRFEPDVIEVERKDLRPHMVWKDEEWFRCQKRHLIASEFSAGRKVEVKTKVEPFGNIWAPAITMKENEDGTLLVKYKSLSGGEDEYTKTSVPYSKIRPSPPPFVGSRCFGLMENVDAPLECGWCPSVVSKVLCWDRYTVLLGPNNLSKDFAHSQLRPSMEWKDGAWQTQEKAHEEFNKRESVNKRKRGQHPQTKPKQKTWKSASRTPDPMLNSVVEKHVDDVSTPKAKETTMVLPFVKKSLCWKVFESMDIFKAVPQHPHFIPLLQCEEEFREGEAIGAMVNFTGLLEKVRDIQVHDSVSAIIRIRECFLKLEEHGFDVTWPISRIHKLLSIKERQTLALEELQVAEKKIAEKDNKRRKLEDEIAELQRQEALLNEEKVTKEKEIARMKYQAVVHNRSVQWVENMFRATVKAPWY